jgi:hypothetical protein
MSERETAQQLLDTLKLAAEKPWCKAAGHSGMRRKVQTRNPWRNNNTGRNGFPGSLALLAPRNDEP